MLSKLSSGVYGQFSFMLLTDLKAYMTSVLSDDYESREWRFAYLLLSTQRYASFTVRDVLYKIQYRKAPLSSVRK